MKMVTSHLLEDESQVVIKIFSLFVPGFLQDLYSDS